jgi:prolyl-tRNA synthetase
VMSEAVVGGNETDIHLKGIVPGRDFPLSHVHDLRNAGEGDPCPRCGSRVMVKQAIEIGHVFKLGTKYSKAMGATFLDDKGNETPLIMGCYGIGVNRIVAAAIEASHDDNGIIWPLPLAPYDVVVVPLQTRNADVIKTTEALEKQFEAAGVDVVVDDREHRPGVKFNDADLIGIPLRVVISERGLKEGMIEVKWRTDAQRHLVPVATAGEDILGELDSTRKQHEARCDERRNARADETGR